jgi:hypothetical protein
MLLAISNMAGLDLDGSVLAILGLNLGFIAWLSFFPKERERLLSKLIGV